MAGYCFSNGIVKFSNNGQLLASTMFGSPLVNPYNRVDLYDFDRCDGKISFRNFYRVPFDYSSYPLPDWKSGLCFSPNDSLLYLSNFFTVYQMNVNDTSVSSPILISGPDTIMSQFAYYDQLELAADDRLYIGNKNGTRKYMSYIDSPNVRGLGCAFRPQGLWQPYTNLLSPPNMPNYGLGPDNSKPCWPLGLSESGEYAAAEEWVIYPNPAHTQLTIESEALKEGLNHLSIFNLMGQCVYEENFKTSSGKHTVSMRGLSAGLYVVRVNGMVRRLVKE